MLSVVIPVYNEEKNVLKAVETISGILTAENIQHELLLIDDGSKDKSWQMIERASQQTHYHTRGIRFSRNFGKEAAILAGLTNMAGDCGVVIDCDLQHPPQKIVEMYRLWEQGYQVVEGVKVSRGKENALHSLAANMFYRVISRAMQLDMSKASDFKLLDRAVVEAVIAMRERHIFFRGISSWVGFRKTTVSFEVLPRLEGESKWPIRSLCRYATSNIASFTTVPLQAVTILGVLFFFCSILLGAQTLWHKMVGDALEGFTTVILLLLIIGSILMICLGIIGYYLARIYEEIKDRPRYLVSEQCGDNLEKID